MTTPILILSDSPMGRTGLGRVARQIADRMHAVRSGDDRQVFDVAMSAVGGTYSKTLAYPYYAQPGDYSLLPYAWRDFAGERPGIIFTVMNAAWLAWLAAPQGIFKDWLAGSKIQKWAYVPVDAESVGGKLPMEEAAILSKFDRVLAYTSFGSEIIGRSLREFPEWQVPWRQKPIPHLPHGTDAGIFYPRSREEARAEKFCERILGHGGKIETDLMLGIIATNSQRKQWPLALGIVAELKARGINVALWAHTNALVGSWNLPVLVESFGVKDCVQITTNPVSDEAIAWGYAACDVVLGIAREGWGMPLSEALACGVPVVTGNYAGATEFVPEAYRVDAHSWLWDGYYCSRVPVFRAADWADRIEWAVGNKVSLNPKFTWDGCWPAWEAWLKEGL